MWTGDPISPFHYRLKGEITQRHIQRAALAVSSPSEELNMFDPVEEKLRMQIEEEKKSYKTMFNHFKGLKVEIEHLQLLMEKVKMKMKKDFEVWWSEEAKNLQNYQISGENVQEILRQNDDVKFPDIVKSHSRTPPSSSTSIPLTGDSQADADILAFIKARQRILQKKGHAVKSPTPAS
ncbi:kinesin-like protein KIF6 [Pitangus sulphuratus]|nr:kinesin-like protein KIF6 [Pitangus sulphuratus]